MDFVHWSKIPRLHRDWEITEKIDGTNGILHWSPYRDGRFDDNKVLATNEVEGEKLYLFAGSRHRWLTPGEDNYGFAAWAKANADDLIVLGQGRHFGEWYGHGIQRGYGMTGRRFALFDTEWAALDPDLPPDVDVVPVLMTADGGQLNYTIRGCIEDLRLCGSQLVPGFKDAEGVVARHKQHGSRFKVLLVNDEVVKGEAA